MGDVTVPRVVVYAAAGLAVAYTLACGLILRVQHARDQRRRR